MQDFEISDLTIDGGEVLDSQGNGTTPNAALIGLYLNRISTSKFINVQLKNMKRITSGTPSIGIKVTTVGGTDGSNWNLFLNCSIWGAAQGVLLTSEGGSTGNASHNMLVGLSIGYWSELATNAGIVLGDCDNNSIIRAWIFAYPPPVGQQYSGWGVLVYDKLDSGQEGARANYFYHLQPGDPNPNSFKVVNATYDTEGNPRRNKNLMIGYDRENSQNRPRAFKSDGTEVSPADFLFWIESNGTIHLGHAASSTDPLLDGTLEYLTSKLYYTIDFPTSSATRYQLAP
jgi:hypothetical protein